MKSTLTVKNNLTPSLKRIQKELSQVPGKAYKYWESQTPIRSGNARRSTSLQGDTIKATYPYATRLNEGSSKQAPQGMSEPTDRFVAALIKRIMRK
jgi:hypothetical protein